MKDYWVSSIKVNGVETVRQPDHCRMSHATLLVLTDDRQHFFDVGREDRCWQYMGYPVRFHADMPTGRVEFYLDGKLQRCTEIVSHAPQ